MRLHQKHTPMSNTHTALYRCLHCHQRCERVLNKGARRKLWCGICACRRSFARVLSPLKAPTWPPPERETQT